MSEKQGGCQHGPEMCDFCKRGIEEDKQLLKDITPHLEDLRRRVEELKIRPFKNEIDQLRAENKRLRDRLKKANKKIKALKTAECMQHWVEPDPQDHG